MRKVIVMVAIRERERFLISIYLQIYQEIFQ